MALVNVDTSGMTRLLEELDRLGGDVKQVTEKALRKAAVRVMNDTLTATSAANFPAGGVYSSGDTRESVIHFPKVVWDGDTAYVPIGFDFSLPGAGGFLISGTPRMAPDQALRKMYKQKGYMAGIQRGMQEEIWDEIVRIMEG